MKTVTIQIPDKKYAFFIELITSLGLKQQEVVSSDEPDKQQILNGIKDAVEEVKQIKAGRRKAVLLKDFLDEL